MTDIDLEAVRTILAPLDLVPVFQVPAGDFLRGFTGHEPRVEVRGVHASAFGVPSARGGARTRSTWSSSTSGWRSGS